MLSFCLLRSYFRKRIIVYFDFDSYSENLICYLQQGNFSLVVSCLVIMQGILVIIENFKKLAAMGGATRGAYATLSKSLCPPIGELRRGTLHF